jgi:Do/DeqQ family serine protease
MKNIISFVMAGIIGGLVTFAMISHFQQPEAPMSHQSQFVANTTPGTLPFDFVEAAERATQAVVHIKAAESEVLAKQRRQQEMQQNPFFRFDDFFGGNREDLFFGFPFNMPNYPKQGSGSGVIISEDGYIVTNNHVVGFADEIIVTLYDGRQLKGQKIGTDPNSDLAVIKIEETGLPTLDYGDSDDVKVGEWVLAVGNPFDYLTSTVTAGIVSAKGRDIDIIRDHKAIEEFIQTDAAINPGNSGGALVDARGRLIGINTAIATKTGFYNGYSFAIPVNLMTKIVDDIIKYGNFQRAQLGVQVDNIDEEYQKILGIDFTEGVIVTDVIDGGSAQYAGIIPNDVITSVNDEEIKNYDDLARIIAKSRIGDTIDLKVVRDGRNKNIPVRLRKGL